MSIQHSFPKNLINYDKNNYRKYKQVHVNEKIFNNPQFKLTSYSTPKQAQSTKTLLKTNNPNDNATYNSSNPKSGLNVKRNLNSNDYLNRLNINNDLTNNSNHHYDVDYHNHNQPLSPSPSKIKEQEIRFSKFEAVLNSGCCPIHFNHENSQHKLNEDNSQRTERYSQTFVNNLNLNNERVLDLSGYLIFVTTSHQGDEIKVYG